MSGIVWKEQITRFPLSGQLIAERDFHVIRSTRMGVAVFGWEVAVVQVVENRADIEGDIVAVQEDRERPGFRNLTVFVRSVRPVEGYPNLFADAVGKRLQLLMRDDAPDVAIGTAVTCRIRRSAPTTIFGEGCAATKR
jgi:hypothetical protein